MPKVSVVMAAHNSEDYIAEAVDSILEQSHTNLELIVIDDGSADRTAYILGNYQDPRLRILRQEHGGLSRTLNKGIAVSKGEYIARMDDDDISLPLRLERQVEFLDRHPEVGLVGSYCRIIGGIHDDRIIHLPITNDEIRRHLLKDNAFIHSAALMRRAALDHVGFYDEEIFFADYELWIRIAALYQVANIPEVLVLRRERSSSMTRKISKSRSYGERARIQLRAMKTFSPTPLSFYYVSQSLAAMILWWLVEPLS